MGEQEMSGLQAALREKEAALEEADRQLACERAQLDRLEAQLLCEVRPLQPVLPSLTCLPGFPPLPSAVFWLPGIASPVGEGGGEVPV